MARLPRLCIAGHTYHVIQRGNNRQPIFASDSDRRDMLHLLLEASRQHGVAVHSYVLMDNHLHLLATPSTDEGLSAMMQQMGRSYVRHFNQRQGRSGTLFEGRFRSALVQTERYLLACMAYIDLNPVRAGIAGQPQDFAWSSYRHYIGVQADRLITPHPHFFNLGNTPFAREKAYKELVDAGLAQELRDRVTSTLLKNHALGDAQFIGKLERSTDRRWQAAKAGRPIGSVKKSKHLSADSGI
jgi:putative transposase